MTVLSRVTQPLPSVLKLGPEVLGHYEEVAKAIGFVPPFLLEKMVVRFMSQHGFMVFDNTEVDHYLATLAEAEYKSWVWRPLRPHDDTEKLVFWGREVKDVEEVRDCEKPFKREVTYRHGFYKKGQNVYLIGPYDKPIPLNILRQVKLLHDEFGEQVYFFVSDYAVVNPDPFIMVTAPGLPQFVFGVWDEPGFGL